MRVDPRRQIPAGLMVTVQWMTQGRVMTSGQILEVPSEITSFYDGSHPGWAPPVPPYRMLRFEMPISRELGPRSPDETDWIAAVLAGHLAAMDPHWPGSEAHVRLYPVVTFSLMYEVTPDQQPASRFPFTAEEMVRRFRSLTVTQDG